MTTLTSDQAIKLLHDTPDAYRTPDSLRALAAQVDADAPGKLTVLYSGRAAQDVGSSDVIQSMVRSGEDVRVIDKSQAAQFLQSEDFLRAVADAHGISPQDLIKGSYRGPATDWLYNATQGPWADASGRFAEATKGEVRGIVNGAAPDRVFGQIELPRALANQNIASIEGASRHELLAAQVKFGAPAPFNMIAARAQEHVGQLKVALDANGAPLRENNVLLMDSRAYFAGTSIQGKAPTFTGPTQSLADRALPLTQHVQAGQVHWQEWQTVMAQTGHGGLSSPAVQGTGGLGATAVSFDPTNPTGHTANLLHGGSLTGAQSSSSSSSLGSNMPASTVASTTPVHDATSPDLHDPRHVASSTHALFNDLKGRLPDASENRLMQFTAACHVNGINEQNLHNVQFNQQSGEVIFASGGLMPKTAVVDVKQPSPPPAQSVEQIQQHDQQQGRSQAQAQQAQVTQKQAPVV
jgi:hypothetical protein